MDSLRIHFTERAIGDLKRFDASTNRRILRRIKWLADNFGAVKPEALTGEFSGFFNYA
jgi:hypothetical protein